jgi:oligopeptide transport system ATP-binding protein
MSASPVASGAFVAPAGVPLLAVRDLTIRFRTGDGEVTAVADVGFDIRPGEVVGLVGESGSGKSQILMSIMGLLAGNGRARGSVAFRGEEILNAPAPALDRLRGSAISMIFQDPMTSLNPYLRVSTQLVEVLERHQGMRRAAATERATEMMERVRVPDAAHRLRLYPHEFSGGMRQRVMIAMALLCRPALLLADEPTTALDVSIQAQIVNLLMDLQRRFDLSLLFISHNLSVVRHISHRVMVLYLGKVMEVAERDEFYARPLHPYSEALISAVPIPDPKLERSRPRIVLAGDLPSPIDPPSGCRFRTRCPKATDLCAREEPRLLDYGGGHRAACHHIPSETKLAAT